MYETETPKRDSIYIDKIYQKQKNRFTPLQRQSFNQINQPM